MPFTEGNTEALRGRPKPRLELNLPSGSEQHALPQTGGLQGPRALHCPELEDKAFWGQSPPSALCSHLVEGLCPLPTSSFSVSSWGLNEWTSIHSTQGWLVRVAAPEAHAGPCLIHRAVVWGGGPEPRGHHQPCPRPHPTGLVFLKRWPPGPELQSARWPLQWSWAPCS